MFTPREISWITFPTQRKVKIKIIQNFALPGEIVELTGRTTGKKQRYSMDIMVRDYQYAKYIREGAAVYDMSDGTTGFSYAYTRIDPWDFI